ncbi:MAG: hypothetical protein K2N06_09605 [Oscillospiraceae bacterium]|nr:hypothetical protein [Oscillospiraceae bacterium]
MAKKSVKCVFCGKETEFTLHANFTVYCPKCKHMIHNECERGYGPVTPYFFLVGDDEIAKVDSIKNRYTLYLDGEEIPLKKTYYDAINEAGGILSGRFGFAERRNNGE